MRTDAADDMEAERILDFLAYLPSGRSSATKKVVARIMLKTDGVLSSRGVLYDIKAKHLGAGVYQLTLKERKQ